MIVTDSGAGGWIGVPVVVVAPVGGVGSDDLSTHTLFFTSQRHGKLGLLHFLLLKPPHMSSSSSSSSLSSALVGDAVGDCVVTTSGTPVGCFVGEPVGEAVINFWDIVFLMHASLAASQMHDFLQLFSSRSSHFSFFTGLPVGAGVASTGAGVTIVCSELMTGDAVGDLVSVAVAVVVAIGVAVAVSFTLIGAAVGSAVATVSVLFTGSSGGSSAAAASLGLSAAGVSLPDSLLLPVGSFPFVPSSVELVSFLLLASPFSSLVMGVPVTMTELVCVLVLVLVLVLVMESIPLPASVEIANTLQLKIIRRMKHIITMCE